MRPFFFKMFLILLLKKVESFKVIALLVLDILLLIEDIEICFFWLWEIGGIAGTERVK